MARGEPKVEFPSDSLPTQPHLLCRYCLESLSKMSRITSRIKPEDEDASQLKFGPGKFPPRPLPFSPLLLFPLAYTLSVVEFDQSFVQKNTLTISEVKVILDTIDQDKQPDNAYAFSFYSILLAKTD